MTSHLPLLPAHLDVLLNHGVARFGPVPTAMWVSSLDTRTRQMSATPPRTKRVYRNIDAPGGASLYWDQPLVVAAHAVSAATGDGRYRAAAKAYARDFLAHCVAPNGGLFLWGNHYFWDVGRGCPVWFAVEEDPHPCVMAEEYGRLHETRPVPPAWETFWQIDPAATARCIRQMGEWHVVDPATGCFNRHADRQRSCAFLESGGILVEALCWLAGKTGERGPVELALRVARYSFENRGRVTGLLENNPTETRWDKHVCTTEVGLWAGGLLRAADASGCAEFAEMADAAMRAYLRYGYDAPAGRYFGMLRVADGQPVREERTTPYQPGFHAGLWNPLFPTHDYPWCFAETCAALAKRTGAEEYRQAVERWVQIAAAELPAGGAYAEHYGRCLHFLVSAGATDVARQVTDEATRVLWADGMFRTHPGEDRYDAVDGLGWLALALIYLETGREPDLMGLGF